MASADFCEHDPGCPGSPRLSGKPYSRVRTQISPDKNVNFHRTSSPSTIGVCRERFRCPRAAHLRVSLGLYGVSVRSLAVVA